MSSIGTKLHPTEETKSGHLDACGIYHAKVCFSLEPACFFQS